MHDSQEEAQGFHSFTGQLHRALTTFRLFLGSPSFFTWTIRSRNVNSAKRGGESEFTRVGARRKIDLMRL